MTPWQLAKAWQDNHDTQDFWELLGEHLSSGYVWNVAEGLHAGRRGAVERGGANL
jgi:hypothetical protein